MDEWWTYRLSDFLLFSSKTYYRLFELYNTDIWPVHILAAAFAAAIVLLVWRRPPWHGRAVSIILAVCWLWVAWAYHLQRYATINWAATYYGSGFLLEALLFVWSGVVGGRLVFSEKTPVLRCAGPGVFLFALVVEPLVAPLAGRPWSQAEYFGIAPDPTVIATMGILLLVADRIHWELFVIPVLWCLISAATLWTMKSPEAFVMAFVVLIIFVALVWKRFCSSRQTGSSKQV